MDVRRGSAVQTGAGRLQGLDLGGVSAYLGVPYAAPPTGLARFAPPRPARPWKGVRDATRFGPRAPQHDDALAGHVAAGLTFPPSRDRSTREACLRLNVWTPAPDQGRRPVMVWLHGGGFETGSGASPLYDGANLAREQDVVVVTLNHRLGVLGFLDLESIGGPAFHGAGAAGLLDIVAALRWVSEEIGAFGGDPGAVTVFGESGGAAKAAALLTMPAARGLFHRLILQSGPAVDLLSAAEGADLADRLAHALGVRDGDAFRRLPLAALLRAQRRLASFAGSPVLPRRPPRRFAPVVDGRILTGDPFAGDPPLFDVPLLIGGNQDEMTLFMPPAWVGELERAGLPGFLAPHLGHEAEAVIAAWRAARPGASDWELLAAITTELRFARPSLALAARQAARGRAPVYAYRFTWSRPVRPDPLGATHALEIPFVFDTLAAAGGMLGGAADAAALAQAMSRAWAGFARAGRPEVANGPAWPVYEAGRRATMLFGRDVRLTLDEVPPGTLDTGENSTYRSNVSPGRTT